MTGVERQAKKAARVKVRTLMTACTPLTVRTSSTTRSRRLSALIFQDIVPTTQHAVKHRDDGGLRNVYWG
jgi:hypothetical protein